MQILCYTKGPDVDVISVCCLGHPCPYLQTLGHSEGPDADVISVCCLGHPCPYLQTLGHSEGPDVDVISAVGGQSGGCDDLALHVGVHEVLQADLGLVPVPVHCKRQTVR